MEGIKIIMQSEVFGREEFGPYDSWAEAGEAIGRLKKSSLEQQDYIERFIGIVVNEGIGDDECTS